MVKYKPPPGYVPSLPTTDEEAYHYTRWWLNHVENYGKDKHITKGKGKQKKELTAQQKADRKRFFITQAQKNKNPKFGIPTSSQHKDFFKNHQGAKKEGKAKQKTKHLERQAPQREEDPEEGPAPKQARIEEAPFNEQELEEAMADENEPDQSGIPMELSDAPGGGGGGGGGGVGHSTGNWNCDTIWEGNTCTTYASRHCVCLMRDLDKYQAIGNQNGRHGLDAENQTQYFGFTTPWNYLDFNKYRIHFSPRDWQHLVNNFSRWRPRAVHIKIFNLQVIQKTVTGDGTQYSNDLTGTIQIFADQEGRYPRILYPNQVTQMGSFPNQIYYLPQYAYLSAITSNNTTTTVTFWNYLNELTAFYCLDESPSQMLRTGNEWQTSYEFPDSTPWCNNRVSTVSITQRQNPLYDTWNVGGRGDDAKRGNFATWRSPWYPGPYIYLSDTTAAGQQLDDIANVAVRPDGMPLAPGLPQYRPEADKDEYLHTFWVPKKEGMNEGDIRNRQIDAATANKVQVETSSLYNTNARSGFNTTISQGGVPTPVTWSGCVPGMIWDNRPATYFDPICQQFPETDEQFKIHSQLGGIPVKESPGHVFVKVTPKPTGASNGLVDEYATFTCTVAIEWELEHFTTHRWNMRNVISYLNTDARAGRQIVDENGQYQINTTCADLARFYETRRVPRTN
ncbi:VP1 [Meleagris gallopavo enteric parvovirus]|uniref:VP1 n=1 Tax=Meleagris gallopavo enteric parvovirus TaxID=1633570 RepID=A0A0D5ZDD7_9VIRU|nr:VP1 [Meleagris gallopavo enteric parvovirus]